MKKLICLFSLLMLGLNCNAVELYPLLYESGQPIYQDVTTNGNSDVVKIPSKNPSNLMESMFKNNRAAVILTRNIPLKGKSDSLKSGANTATSNQNSTNWGSLNSAASRPSIAHYDPYIVPVNGINYVMVKDKKGNDWSEQDLLGINDPKDNMFLSLRRLESDGNYTRLTPQELKNAGIRLVKLNTDGVLLVKERKQDFDLKKIDYIDMMNIKKTANSQSTGIFGHFNVYMKTNNPKMVVGYVTFDTHSNLKILFR